MIKAVCVFCGSSEGDEPCFREAAERTGRLLAANDLTLIYGGGGIGLMGVVADAVLAEGGKAVGVIPRSLAEKELAHGSLSDLHVVESMHQRKAMMADLADAFVALPGGFGTWEELCEIITWRQLGIHAKPIGLLNVAGFYDALLAQFDLGVQRGFVAQAHRDLLLTATRAESLIEQLQKASPKPMRPWMTEEES